MKTSIRFVIAISILLAVVADVNGQSAEERLVQLNISLPAVPAAIGKYVDYTQVGNLLFLSGKGPKQANGEYIKGKVGAELSVEQAYAAARLTAINQLAVLKLAVGDLNKIKRIVKVNGYVNSSSTFYDQPKVVDGFSDLMIEVFGDAGKHSRTSVGVASLPMNMAIEVEIIVELK